ncbi:MAG TPA: methyltransferase dimerization domain-containing protein, partial [Thermomicrobiales bacterium]|nr:methyltransferase dimerization domain-containing protein [Thermomicrobiales bacterium]
MFPGTEGLSPRAALVQLITASWVSHTVRAMAALSLADHLADGPRTSAELADATGTDASTLARFLRTLAALGLVAHDAEDRAGLTPLGELLRANVPGSLRPYALAIAAPHVERAWHELPQALRTGEPSF